MPDILFWIINKNSKYRILNGRKMFLIFPYPRGVLLYAFQFEYNGS